ncbi:MAG: hypothetical protein GX445_06050 [Elusimicrobia bacterium]|nr:hypothetical protein [Elusimicrobiota bacterium]
MDELIELKKAGADEIYFAYNAIPNYANTGMFYNLIDVRKLIKLSHNLKMKVHLAANEINLSDSTNTFLTIIANIRKIINFGIDGIIVSDIGLLKRIKSEFNNIPVHLSSLNPVFNLNSLKFFYDSFKISRVILPNQLSALEAKNIINFAKKNKIETEIFFYKFFGCPYINGFCMMHTDAYLKRIVKSEDGLCRAGLGLKPAKIQPFNIAKRMSIPKELMSRVSYRVSFGGSPRVLNRASFFDYYVLGIDYLKYGTRTDPTEKRIHSVKMMKKVINLIEKLLNKYDDTEKAREFFLKIDI